MASSPLQVAAASLDPPVLWPTEVAPPPQAVQAPPARTRITLRPGGRLQGTVTPGRLAGKRALPSAPPRAAWPAVAVPPSEPTARAALPTNAAKRQRVDPASAPPSSGGSNSGAAANGKENEHILVNASESMPARIPSVHASEPEQPSVLVGSWPGAPQQQLPRLLATAGMVKGVSITDALADPRFARYLMLEPDNQRRAVLLLAAMDMLEEDMTQRRQHLRRLFDWLFHDKEDWVLVAGLISEETVAESKAARSVPASRARTLPAAVPAARPACGWSSAEISALNAALFPRLSPSCSGEKTAAEGMIRILLHHLEQGASVEDTAKLFNVTPSVAQSVIWAVVAAIQSTFGSGLSWPDVESEAAPAPPAKYKYFERALGAVDCTLIPVKPTDAAPAELARWQCADGTTATNVFLGCDWDLQFRQLIAGMEGAERDGAFLSRYACYFQSSVPEGRFVVGDCSFGNTSKLLVPFKVIRRRVDAAAPESAEDLFNQYHTALHQRIGCAIALLKQRFKILQHGVAAPSKRIAHVVAACVLLHNFLQERRGMLSLQELTGTPHAIAAAQVLQDSAQADNTALSLHSQDKLHELLVCDRRSFRSTLADLIWEDYRRSI